MTERKEIVPFWRSGFEELIEGLVSMASDPRLQRLQNQSSTQQSPNN